MVFNNKFINKKNKNFLKKSKNFLHKNKKLLYKNKKKVRVNFLKRDFFYKNASVFFFNKIRKSKNNMLYFLGKRFMYNLRVKLVYILNKIFGIGFKRFLYFFSAFYGYSINTKLIFVSMKMFEDLQKRLRFLVLNYQLRRQIKENIMLKRKYKMLPGVKHILYLPTRGQRTKTNAGTAKNRRGF